MINANELRAGNYMLHKLNGKISRVPCALQHLEVMAKGELTNFYPVVLKPELLEKAGFIENKKYALYPEAHEFRLLLPVNGSNINELVVYIKSNGESFGRAVVNDLVASNNFYHLHQLQNLYFSLTGEELTIKQ